MYDNLKSLGITNPEEIDRYSLSGRKPTTIF